MSTFTTNTLASGTSPNPGGNSGTTAASMSSWSDSIPHLRLAPYLTGAPSSTSATLSPSLRFPVIERFIPPGVVIKVGRYTERSNRHQSRNNPTAEADTPNSPSVKSATPNNAATGAANPTADANELAKATQDVLFKSKVVSRSHAEIWIEDGKFYIRDTSSSSGTFLNHTRLSAQNVRSDAHRLRDGDCLQLGVEYRGGEEEIYRCVRMRVELNRRSVASTALRMATLTALVEAQASLRQLKAPSTSTAVPSHSISARSAHHNESDATTPQSPACRLPIGPVTTDCCICLLPLRRTPLFLTPCAHAFHYACIRTLLGTRRNRGGRTVFEPVDGFSCPMCRSYVDLTAEPADEDADEEVDIAEMTAINMALGASVKSHNSTSQPISRLPPASLLTPVDPALLAHNDPATPCSPQMPRLIPARNEDAGLLTASSLHFPHHTGTDDDIDIPMDAGGLSSADDADADIETTEREGHETARDSPAPSAADESAGIAIMTSATSPPIQVPGSGQSTHARGIIQSGASDNVGMDMDINNTADIDLTALLGKTVQTSQPSMILAAESTTTHADSITAANNRTNHMTRIAGVGNLNIDDSISTPNEHSSAITSAINSGYHGSESTTTSNSNSASATTTNSTTTTTTTTTNRY